MLKLKEYRLGEHCGPFFIDIFTLVILCRERKRVERGSRSVSIAVRKDQNSPLNTPSMTQYSREGKERYNCQEKGVVLAGKTRHLAASITQSPSAEKILKRAQELHKASGVCDELNMVVVIDMPFDPLLIHAATGYN
ncbi:hypothetical protein SADUNF_Sadunf12G0095000 [Salix dunnii]|uniref:Uncharacterized protein n=1 Tax=Salix dunnii TaxID=1413687 RepID=A0A835MNC1_9ROSI|nr:hypothetical protein SADUNF_Sadunf12G0095000 [Salix dunnii]